MSAGVSRPPHGAEAGVMWQDFPGSRPQARIHWWLGHHRKIQPRSIRLAWPPMRAILNGSLFRFAITQICCTRPRMQRTPRHNSYRSYAVDVCDTRLHNSCKPQLTAWRTSPGEANSEPPVRGARCRQPGPRANSWRMQSATCLPGQAFPHSARHKAQRPSSTQPKPRTGKNSLPDHRDHRAHSPRKPPAPAR
jgi:hypothetical protein